MVKVEHDWNGDVNRFYEKFLNNEIQEGTCIGVCGHAFCGDIRVFVSGPSAKNPNRAYCKCPAECVNEIGNCI
jgi:hypothetical protein